MYISAKKPAGASKQPARAPGFSARAASGFKPSARKMADARLALADAQSHFASPSLFSPPKAINAKEAEGALASCFHAISAWRSLSGSLAKGTPEWLEAQLALGSLYSMRGMICKRNYEEAIVAGRKTGIWVLRSGEAFEAALACFKAAAALGLPGVNEQALKQTLKDVHEEIFWSYYTLAVLSVKKGRAPLPFPRLEKLADLPGKAGGYACKATYHGAMSSALGLEI